MGGEGLWLRESLAASGAAPLGRWTLALTAVVAASLVLEIWYAWGFYQLVRGQTVGADGIWFASRDDARFRKLIRATAVANVPLCLFLACYLAVVLR
jgi:hypothetical protein